MGGRLEPADRDLMNSEVCLEYRTKDGKREMESQLRRPNGCISGILERKHGKGLMSEKVRTEDASELREGAHAVDFRESRVPVSKSKRAEEEASWQ